MKKQRIKIIAKDILIGIIKKNDPKISVSDIENKFMEFSRKDSEIIISQTTFSNDLGKHTALTMDIVRAIVYLFLEDYKKEQSTYYNLEDFQKIFAHFDQEDLQLHGKAKRDSLNELITTLASENEEFKGISLDEEWRIEGGKAEPIDKYYELIREKVGKQSDLKFSWLVTFFHEIKKSPWLGIGILSITLSILAYYFFRKYYILLVFLSMVFLILGIYKNLSSKEVKNRWVKVGIIISFLAGFFIWGQNSVLKGLEEYKLYKRFEKEPFETYSKGNGILTVHNQSRDNDFKYRNKIKAGLGDTIQLVTYIKNSTDLDRVTVKHFPVGNNYNSSRHYLAGSIITNGGSELTDMAYVELPNNLYLQEIRSGYVNHGSGENLNKLNLKPSYFDRLYGNGLLIAKAKNEGFGDPTQIITKYVVKERIRKAGFNYYPSRSSTGFCSVNKIDCNGKGCENRSDIIDFKNISNLEGSGFTMFIHFLNSGPVEIKNARAEFFFEDADNSTQYVTAKLWGDNVPPIYDSSLIRNLPLEYNLTLSKGRVIQTHDANHTICKDVNINRELFENEKYSRVIELGNMSIRDIGYCHEGIIALSFEVVKVDDSEE